MDVPTGKKLNTDGVTDVPFVRTAHGFANAEPLVLEPGDVIEVGSFTITIDSDWQPVIRGRQCVMHADDDCSTVLPCEQCPNR